MSYKKILEELDPQQREAATVTVNAVVAAGAGSGKTKVLAARYAWLIMERGCRTDEILTLTFTRKAVTEMYSRIYGLLASCGEAKAKEAVAEFYKARIFTIDSYCAGIARTAARRYGITPDFVIDDEGAADMAKEMALPFILEHRTNPTLRSLTASKKIRTVADELFAGTILRHCAISAPLDFEGFKKAQGKEIAAQWKKKTEEAASLIRLITDELFAVKKQTAAYAKITAIINDAVPPPEPDFILKRNGFLPGETGEAAPVPDDNEGSAAYEEIKTNLLTYMQFLSELKSVPFMGKTSQEMLPIKETIGVFKDSLYDELEALANFILQSPVIASVFPLLAEFQTEFNRRKREAGILTFQDVSRLAVDALSRYPDIRRAQKKTIRAIMIDEFQDDNALQRDLLFLLAENEERMECGIPNPQDICPGKLFFVGDEKQSIYRFRGADVSVFRRLGRDLASQAAETGETGQHLSLITNYRSAPALIHAFNQFFGGFSPGGAPERDTHSSPVFLPVQDTIPEFEAGYSRVEPHGETGNGTEAERLMHFCFVDKDKSGAEDTDKSDMLSADEIEAAFTAARIRALVESETLIRERGSEGTKMRPCRYSDITILFRTLSKQGLYEKQLRSFGIPYAAESLGGLFTDAPVNDLYNMLRLAVYPQDTNAYAAVLRSPFVRLADTGVAVSLLKHTGIPFDENIEQDIPAADLEAYRRGRTLYTALIEDSKNCSAAELITKLWYDEGYRYETLWNERAQMYGELYDFFFELARQSDERGKTLTDFLDRIGGFIESGEKINDLDIPMERISGVRLMSIHKSKGLEFPIVFLCSCSNAGKPNYNDKPIYYSDDWGISLNVRTAGGLPGKGGNYFFNSRKTAEEQKETAELRRLLYVAMTRAESRLFVTGSLPVRVKADKEAADSIGGRICQAARKIQDSENSAVKAFSDLIFPAIASCAVPLFTVEEIPVIDRKVLLKQTDTVRKTDNSISGMYRRAREAKPLYGRAEEAETAKQGTDRLTPSSLRAPYDPALFSALPPQSAPAQHQTQMQSTPAAKRRTAQAKEQSPQGELFTDTEDNYTHLDGILEKAGLTPADFGVIAHTCVESRFTGNAPHIPPRIHSKLDESGLRSLLAAAQNMANVFFTSPLGQLCLSSARRESEFPFMSLIQLPEKKAVLTGRIDLLFETADSVYAVDFKTDTEEDVSRHVGQLAAYLHAAAHIFGKPVRCRLFYLRSGADYDITEAAQSVNLAEIAGAALAAADTASGTAVSAP